MNRKANTLILYALLCALVVSSFIPLVAQAQTAATGSVLGVVMDPTGATVPGAQVQMVNTANNASMTVVCDDQGKYAIPNVAPGTYTVTTQASGFRQSVVTGVVVEVTKTTNLNIKLVVGGISSTVEVSAQSAQMELQTADATIGDIVGTEALLRLPTRSRSAQELLLLQPGTTRQTGSGTGASIAGAENDQTTFTLDGIDITDQNTNSTVDTEHGARPVVAISVDSVDEFRVGVTNSNASFGRSSGGQVTLIGRSGTNALHGAGFWYHQNSVLNANTWDNNRLGITKPSLRDNRFGGRFGGPVIKDKTFYFVDYEGRRYPQQLAFSRTVPTATMRQGILQFRDASGSVIAYNLATAQVCGSSGNAACDPRGIGISPSMKALFGLDPPGNNPGVGDGLNTIGFQGNVRAPLTDDYAVARLDHTLNAKWHFNGSLVYGRNLAWDTSELDIRDPNNPKTLAQLPNWTTAIIAGVTGQLAPKVVNSFRFGDVRNRNGAIRTDMSTTSTWLAIPGTSTSAGYIALTPGQVNAPIDMNNSIRSQRNNDVNLQFIDDLTWVKGSHLFQFGGNFQHLTMWHRHNGKNGSAVNSLNAIISADTTSFLSIPAVDRPRACGGSVTTNCLGSSYVTSWDQLYAASLGMLDNTNIFLVRNGDLAPQPFGTALDMDAVGNAYSFYGQDTWRIHRSFTLTYGLSYGWQTPVTFRDQKEAFLIDAGTSQILTEDGYLSDKRDAALRGQIYNPLLGFLPVAKSGRSSVYDADYGNIAPRIAAAWSPSYSNGLLGKVFGKERTVLRGGFGIYYSRINGEATVVGPGLTAGFTSTLTTGLTNCRVSGAPGQGCNSTSTSDPAQSTFRVGVDGPIPIPIVTNVSSPIIPAGNYSELASYSIDPGIKLPRIYTANFTVQSRVAHGVILEVGWSGRYGRRLLANSNINANPYFFLDTASNQTFAQAFDVVATALRAGQTPAAQAWFENQLPGAGGTATSTAFLISKYRSSFTTGLVSTLFSNIDNIRLSMGKQAYDEMQVNQLRMLGNSAYSNYNAMMATVRRNGANFSFNVNYTFSKSLDSYLGVQNDSGCLPNPYYPGVNYGPSSFDRTHTLNARFIYNLPSRWSGVGGALNKILGGWYISGIFSADSGIPLTVTESSQVYGGGQTNVNSTGAIPIVSASAMDQGVHGGVAGSGGVGTNGNPATGGSGLNMFADPQAAFNNFRPVLLSADMRNGRSNPLRGLPLWNLDSSIGKKLPITERVNWVFSFDFYNMLNHVSFNNPSLNLTSPATFGVISSSVVPANRQAGSRWIMFGTRIEF